LQRYTVELYREIEELSGESCGMHLTGGIMLAGTKERMDWLKMAHAKGRYLGMQTEIISAAECKQLLPLIDESKFVGGMYDPHEGDLDPYGTTHAYAKSARKNGAEIVLRNRVVDTIQRTDGTWDVITEQGNVHAEHVVNCGGLWARECGRMVGLELPLLAMEHMYLLTDTMPEVAEINATTGRRVLTALDFEGEIYIRQERDGMLMGTYEKACRPWSERQTPWSFGHELLEPDLDRIAPSLEVGFEHFPAFANAGLRKIINGPFTFAPDGNPLVGPIRGLRNYWVACAVMAGFSQGGGVGLALSQWMVNGDPGFDVFGMDVARYGDWTTMGHTNAKVKENYSRRFRIRFPNEELPAARPFRTTAIYDKLVETNAVMGDMCGLEHALWFAPSRAEAKDEFSFRRSNDFAHVAAEVRAVRTGVGLIEISNFAKYQISGKGAEAFLDRLLPNRLPAQGRMVLTPMLNEQGKLIGDFTVARAADDRFMMFGSGLAEQYHLRWFDAHKPDDVTVKGFGLGLTGLAIAGPKSRELLSRLAGRDVSGDAFRFMAYDEFDVGHVPARVGRVSYTGELGYEIWVAPEHLRALYDLLTRAGEDLGLKLFGARALNALRLDKSFGSWSREYRPIYTPWEARLDRFVALQKRDFVGRDAAHREHDGHPERVLTTFVVEADNADVIGDEPIWRNGMVVGWVTSGGYAHWSGKSVALGYVNSRAQGGIEGTYEIEIIGERRKAVVQAEPLYDPKGEKMRS
ncbi:MAG: FAD-dependent oxidoreductase, partial [Ancalomicrobiaceae bacterium]|nr:FAD-dependent oxidoreductase [Ancalomicrobiaceae bacterium]